MIKLVVLDYGSGCVNTYTLPDDYNSQEEIEKFLFDREQYKDSDIYWMYGEDLTFNNYNLCNL